MRKHFLLLWASIGKKIMFLRKTLSMLKNIWNLSLPGTELLLTYTSFLIEIYLYILQYFFRSDKIFWIGHFIDDFYQHPKYQSKIFEILESNGIFRFKSFGNSESSMRRALFFPPVITPMHNGKLIFYPQKVNPHSILFTSWLQNDCYPTNYASTSAEGIIFQLIQNSLNVLKFLGEI